MIRISSAPHAITGTLAVALLVALLGVALAGPAPAAQPLFPQPEAARAVEPDIVEVVLERHLALAADRAARPDVHRGA